MEQQKTTMEKRRLSKNEKNLNTLFEMFRKRESIVFSDRSTHFSNTELHLIGEVLRAKYEGRRLISTQLADMLGITRSAVSQIVNNLEKRNVVKRVADDVDRKIAYIEVTQTMLDDYDEDLKNCMQFIGRVVKEFGDDKFKEMCGLYEEFMALIERERKGVSAPQKKTKKATKNKKTVRK